MLRLHLRDAAVAAAKAHAHPRVEPRHVAYAVATYLRERPRAALLLQRARAALDPRGTSYEVPVFAPEAEALVDGIASEEEALALLERLVGEGGADGASDGAPSVSSTSAAPDEEAAGAPAGPTTGEGDAPETVEDVLAELDQLVGLESVKTQVRGVIAVVRANQLRAEAGHPTVDPGLHLVFTGSPGTGKTTVARLVARLYKACGALPGAKLTEVDRSRLVAGYVGQTAIRTAEAIAASRPGVLFIDEAYALAPSHDSDFGAEAIATLVKGMEDHRADLAVIAAGYPDEMAAFLASNPGLRSRFNTVIHFPDYAPSELTLIFERLVNAAGLRLGAAALEKAADVFREAASREAFGNARFARSLFEQAYARMALRAAEDGTLEMRELMALTPEDLSTEVPPEQRRARRIGFRDSSPGPEEPA